MHISERQEKREQVTSFLRCVTRISPNVENLVHRTEKRILSAAVRTKCGKTRVITMNVFYSHVFCIAEIVNRFERICSNLNEIKKAERLVGVLETTSRNMEHYLPHWFGRNIGILSMKCVVKCSFLWWFPWVPWVRVFFARKALKNRLGRFWVWVIRGSFFTYPAAAALLPAGSREFVWLPRAL